MKNKNIYPIFAVLLLVFVLGCTAQQPDPVPDPTPDPEPTLNTLSLSLSGLEPLDAGHYEGWAIYGEEKVTTGKFIVDPDDGELHNLQGQHQDEFTVDRDLALADKIVITIEPEGDTDTVPSGIVILAGDLSGTTASLEYPVDLSSVEGNYILATPTNGEESDETSGVWFIMVPGPEAGLVLPELPDGWKYEGWAVNSGTPLTTGRFTSAEGADEFNDYSGDEDAPPFPGEDFLVNPPTDLTFPINLADGSSKAVISVEPDLDGIDPTGDTPFQIKPLVVDILLDAEDHTNYQMDLNPGTVPSGTATIS